MGFSITGNLLSGSKHRPDILTFIHLKRETHGGIPCIGIETKSTNCRLNTLGYIPGVSTITGLGRVLLGFVHTIMHLACSIFSKNREHHLEEAKLGAKNIGRGLIEALPVIGNITMFIVDKKRMNKFEKMAEDQVDQIDQEEKADYNYMVMFVYGQKVAKHPYVHDFEYEVKRFNPILEDLERIMHNDVNPV